MKPIGKKGDSYAWRQRMTSPVRQFHEGKAGRMAAAMRQEVP